MGRRKKKNFYPKTPSPTPTPGPPTPVYRPEVKQSASSLPSEIQRSANLVAASLFESGVDPVSKKSREQVESTLAAREAIVEVERRLLTFFVASFDGASLKPVEAAALARSLASTIATRRKIELAELDEQRKAESFPEIQNLRKLNAARLAKFVNRGQLYPPKDDPNEISPEGSGAPTGFTDD